MKTYGGVLRLSALDGGEWSASRPCLFTPGDKAPGTRWIGDWVDPRATLDAAPAGNRTPAAQPAVYRYWFIIIIIIIIIT
jgi:hypothetical protein